MSQKANHFCSGLTNVKICPTECLYTVFPPSIASPQIMAPPLLRATKCFYLISLYIQKMKIHFDLIDIASAQLPLQSIASVWLIFVLYGSFKNLSDRMTECLTVVLHTLHTSWYLKLANSSQFHTNDKWTSVKT